MGNEQYTQTDTRKSIEHTPASSSENGGDYKKLEEELDEFRIEQLMRLAKKSAKKGNENNSKQMKLEAHVFHLACRDDPKICKINPYTIKGCLFRQAREILLDGEPGAWDSPLGDYKYVWSSAASSTDHPHQHVGWNLIGSPAQLNQAHRPKVVGTEWKDWDFYMVKPRVSGGSPKKILLKAAEILLDYDIHVVFYFAYNKAMIFCADGSSEIPFYHGNREFVEEWKHLIDLRFILSENCSTLLDLLMAKTNPIHKCNEAEVRSARMHAD